MGVSSWVPWPDIQAWEGIMNYDPDATTGRVFAPIFVWILFLAAVGAWFVLR